MKRVCRLMLQFFMTDSRRPGMPHIGALIFWRYMPSPTTKMMITIDKMNFTLSQDTQPSLLKWTLTKKEFIKGIHLLF